MHPKEHYNGFQKKKRKKKKEERCSYVVIIRVPVR